MEETGIVVENDNIVFYKDGEKFLELSSTLNGGKTYIKKDTDTGDWLFYVNSELAMRIHEAGDEIENFYY